LRSIVATMRRPTTKARISRPSAHYELLYEDGDIGAVKSLDHRFGRLVGFAQHHADTLRALQELDDDRGPTDNIQDIIGPRGIVGEGGDRQSHTIARQQLQGTQFIARTADGYGLVHRIDAHHLELPQHGQPIERMRRGDARDHRLETFEFFAHIAQFAFLEVMFI
jgi:hypothetical protein